MFVHVRLCTLGKGIVSNTCANIYSLPRMSEDVIIRKREKKFYQKTNLLLA